VHALVGCRSLPRSERRAARRRCSPPPSLADGRRPSPSCEGLKSVRKRKSPRWLLRAGSMSLRFAIGDAAAEL